MNVWQGGLVLLAGAWAGTINTVVGSGTLVTFPVLLGIGLPPVTANVTNTLGILPGSITGAWGYRRELTGQGRRIVVLGIASAIGAVVGTVLLLQLPAGAFTAIVPVLILLALLLVIFGPRITGLLHGTKHEATASVRPVLWVFTLLSGVYGGYFGAAQGVVLMGLFGVLLADTAQRHNGLKNLLAAIVNLVASVAFILTAHIDWTAAGLLAVGSIIGGLLGARVGRRLSPTALRAVIVVVGVAAIIKLLL